MGLTDTTGSMVSIDRAGYPDNVGIEQGTYTVQETGVYRYTDPAGMVQSTQFVAGARIPVSLALQYGMLEAGVVEGVAVVGNPVEGEKIAAQLRAAGYELTYTGAPEVTATAGGGETFATDGVDTAPGGAPLEGAGDEAGNAVGDAPKWYQDYHAKASADGGTPVERQDGETEAAFKERIAKDAEANANAPERTNENAPNETK